MAPVMTFIETGDEVKEDMEDMSGDGDSSSVRLTTHLRRIIVSTNFCLGGIRRCIKRRYFSKYTSLE